MRQLIVCIVLIMSVTIIAPILAQDNNPSDNWCFDGGPLEGQCGKGDTDESSWLWLYGFYRAQVSKGALDVNDVPEEYRIGLEDSARGSSSGEVTVIRDGDGNVVSSGNSPNFVGNIVSCRYTDDNTYITVGWVGLDIAGDYIEVGTDEGGASTNTYLPVSDFGLELKFGGQNESISEGGTMNIYYRGLLLGSSELNGVSKCTNDTRAKRQAEKD